MQNKTKEYYMYALGAFIVGGGLTAVVLLIYNAVPVDNKDIVNIALGSLLTMGASVVNYFFGSSRGSDKKTDLMNGSKPE